MDPQTEIGALENTLAGKATPLFSMAGTCGRLAELYLQLPGSLPANIEKARFYAQTGMDVAGKTDPLYQNLRHLGAQAVRLSANPPPDALGANGTCAVTDREAFALTLPTAPRQAQCIAQDWADWAWEHSLWDEAAEAYSGANRALRRYAKLHLTDPEKRLKALVGTSFATRSAYAYAMVDDVKSALLELERGNGFHFQAREELQMTQRLHHEQPDLALRLDQAQAAISALLTGHNSVLALDSLGQFSPQAVAALSAREALIHEIQQVPGYASFARLSDWTDIVAAAARAPILYLALTDKGTALIGVNKGATENTPAAKAMLEVTEQNVIDACTPFFKAEFDNGPEDRRAALMPLLLWLGTHICYPIWAALEHLGHANEPFVLAPTGLLATIPIHAGIIPLPEKQGIRFPFNPSDVTYCYAARGLSKSLQRRDEKVTEGALVINNPVPLPVAYDPLHMADFETQAVLALVPGIELKGMDADTGAVCDELPKAKLAHFCCHGDVDTRIYSSGILLLANSEQLGAMQIRSLAIDARLVVLSACRTASPALGFDQVLSLPSMFLAAGACAVLGTFWHTDDMATLLLMLRFYALWCTAGLTPDVALGQAQAWLMSSSAATLRKALPQQALLSPAAAFLQSTPDDAAPYQHPWYWSAFFLAGA